MANRYNPILDTPPETAEANGREYQVASDFRIALAYIRTQDDPTLTDQDKAVLGLSMFYSPQPRLEDVKELAEHLGWYLRRGRDPQEQPSGRAPIFDIQVDAGRIFAAFLQVYRINLRKARMHWWTFLELLDAMPQGTHLDDVMRIRAKPFQKGMSPAERNELARAKEFYRIETAEQPGDQMAGIFSSLLEIAQ